MFRDPSDAPDTHVNLTFYGGGMGDCIAKMPVVRYLLREYPHVKVDMWVPDYFFELAHYWLDGADRIKVRPFSSLRTECNDSLPALSTKNTTATTIRTHLVHNAFNTLIDLPVPSDPKDLEYYKIEGAPDTKLPEKYIVITTNYTAAAREMKPETINGIIDWADSKGFKVVFLGKSMIDLNEGTGAGFIAKTSRAELHRGISLINQTGLIEAARIMGAAKAVVGLDNGLLHLAACTDVPIVGGFSSVDPSTRMPYRNGLLGYKFWPVVPEESLGCRFCQTRMNMVWGHDFRNCYYSDYLCLSALSAKKYIDKLEEIFHNESV